MLLRSILIMMVVLRVHISTSASSMTNASRTCHRKNNEDGKMIPIGFSRRTSLDHQGSENEYRYRKSVRKGDETWIKIRLSNCSPIAHSLAGPWGRQLYRQRQSRLR